MKSETRFFYQQSLQRVISHLTGNLDASADLSYLARLAGLSPFHFHRVFRGMVGETPLELHRRLRLERAACSLRDSDAGVIAIAFAAGYETHEAFTRAFRAAFGEAPSEYRRNPFARPLLAASCGVHFDPGGTTRPFIPCDTGGHTMHVELRFFPALRLATVAHRGPYNQIGAAFSQLGDIAGRAGLFAYPGAMMIAAYHDDPEATPPAELRSEAAITVPDDVPLPSELGEMRLDAGTYACTTHIGPYAALGDAWTRFLGEALPAQHVIVADGPAYEIYKSDMRTTSPDALETELLVRTA
jgi:AraC family transcriptional regulator